MGLVKKQTSFHTHLAQIIAIIIVVGLVYAIATKLVHRNKKNLPIQKQQTMQMKPTITPHEEKIATLTQIDAKTKRISFPKYKVTLAVPSDYKLGPKEGGYDKPTSNFIVIDTSSMRINEGGYKGGGLKFLFVLRIM